MFDIIKKYLLPEAFAVTSASYGLAAIRYYARDPNDIITLALYSIASVALALDAIHFYRKKRNL